MKKHEKLSLILSVIALTLSVFFSAVTAHYQFFREERSLLVSLPDQLIIDKDGVHKTELVLVNTGTETLAIKDVRFVAFDPKATNPYKTSLQHLRPNLPELLHVKPEQMLVIEVSADLNMDFLENHFREVTREGKAKKAVSLGVHLSTFDSEGKKRRLIVAPYTFYHNGRRAESAHWDERRSRQAIKF